MLAPAQQHHGVERSEAEEQGGRGNRAHSLQERQRGGGGGYEVRVREPGRDLRHSLAPGRACSDIDANSPARQSDGRDHAEDGRDPEEWRVATCDADEHQSSRRKEKHRGTSGLKDASYPRHGERAGPALAQPERQGQRCTSNEDAEENGRAGNKPARRQPDRLLQIEVAAQREGGTRGRARLRRAEDSQADQEACDRALH